MKSCHSFALILFLFSFFQSASNAIQKYPNGASCLAIAKYSYAQNGGIWVGWLWGWEKYSQSDTVEAVFGGFIPAASVTATTLTQRCSQIVSAWPGIFTNIRASKNWNNPNSYQTVTAMTNLGIRVLNGQNPVMDYFQNSKCMCGDAMNFGGQPYQYRVW